ncbi:MAG: putative neutral zinc metallopeptidase, partial [Candidatus Aminicenantes bacterium]|nr:putative neutral zinc metallopeptidase [Candidatus Aminicenantes bacterium]
MFFWDYTYFLIIPPLILAFYAQAKVRSTYAKYSRVGASSRISGAQ